MPLPLLVCNTGRSLTKPIVSHVVVVLCTPCCRWLVLHVNSGTLSYYEDESKKKAPKGVVNLRGATLDVGSRHVALRNLPAFSVTTPDRTYQFCADSDKNYQSWCVSRRLSLALPLPVSYQGHLPRLNLISAALRAASKMTAKNQADPDFKRPYAGFLRKADPRGKNWKKRWIVLTPATKLVEYFPNETKKVKKGDFSLKSATYATTVGEVCTTGTCPGTHAQLRFVAGCKLACLASSRRLRTCLPSTPRIAHGTFVQRYASCTSNRCNAGCHRG